MSAGTIPQCRAIERYASVDRTARSELRASVPDFRATANAKRLQGIQTIQPKPKPSNPDDSLLGCLVLTLLVIAAVAVLALIRYPEIMADPQWRAASTLAPTAAVPPPLFLPPGRAGGANSPQEQTS